MTGLTQEDLQRVREIVALDRAEQDQEIAKRLYKIDHDMAQTRRRADHVVNAVEERILPALDKLLERKQFIDTAIKLSRWGFTACVAIGSIVWGLLTALQIDPIAFFRGLK